VNTRRRLAAAALPLLLLAACASPAQNGGTSTTSGTAQTQVVVFAAASLNTTFDQLGKTFESQHPGVTVKFSYDGSAALVDQLTAGAPADVFASADQANMTKATSAGLMSGTPEQFTTNILTLIVPKGNPAKITGLDSSLDGKKLVICAANVPCGSAAVKLAGLLGVTLHPVSEETKVTDVRTKVETGQADAGIVYVTDAKVSGDKVETIPIKGADKATNIYMIGVPKSAPQADLGAQFIELVKGSEGQQVLKAAGFGQ
jgi:molybdate transport system substrate-binding protein